MKADTGETGDGRSGERDESLEVNSFCTRLSNKVQVLLELKPFQVPARNAFCKREHLPRIPVRLVCVIDVSHSMAEPHGPHSKLSKLDEIKIFGHLLVQCSRPEDHLGIVVFGTLAEVVFPLQKMTEEAKKKLKMTFNEMTLKGVTNMSAGIFLAIDQFNQAFGKKSRSTNDNILLFSDGMPNEGLTDSQELTREINKRIRHVAEECRFDRNYTIKFTTVGTSGFYPETLYHLGRVFGSGAFHHMGDDSCLSSDLMLPVLNLQETVLTEIRIAVTALNGVQFETADSEPGNPAIPAINEPTTSCPNGQFSASPWDEYLLVKRSSSAARSQRTRSISVSPGGKAKIVPSRSIPLNVEGSCSDVQVDLERSGDPDSSVTGCEPRRHYLIHDLGIDMEKHLLLCLHLPKKHKKILKGKDILSIRIEFKDHRMVTKESSLTVAFRDLPPKDSLGSEIGIVTTCRATMRIRACSALDRASSLVAKLDRCAAIQALNGIVEEIRGECDKLLTDTCNEEENYADLYKTVDPLLANLNRCRTYIGDYSVRWDDVWGRLKSLRSSLAREIVTSPGVYLDCTQMFMTEELGSKIKEVNLLLDMLSEELDLGRKKPEKSSSSSSQPPLLPVATSETTSLPPITITATNSAPIMMTTTTTMLKRQPEDRSISGHLAEDRSLEKKLEIKERHTLQADHSEGMVTQV